MQVARRTLLVAVLPLLASVGTASAECAWVLWSTVEHVNVRPGKVSEYDWAPEGRTGRVPKRVENSNAFSGR